MNRRRALAALVLLPASRQAPAQSGGRPARIVFLSAQTSAADVTRVAALRAGLAERGLHEGRDLILSFSWADGHYHRLSRLADDAVSSRADLILAVGTPAVLAARKATSTIPIVFPLSGDPLRTGLVTNLARPGGNVTGFTTLTGELTRKRLELLREALPRLARLGAVANPGNPVHPPALADLGEAVKGLGIVVRRIDVHSMDGMEAALKGARQSVDALFFLPDEMFNTQRERVASLVNELRLPATYYASEWVPSGGLMFYGADIEDLFRRSAGYVDRILRGGRPGDLPVEQPTKFQFLINARTAGVLGLALPRTLMLRADRVFD